MTTSYFVRCLLLASLPCALGCNLVIGDRVTGAGGSSGAASGGTGALGGQGGTGGTNPIGGAAGEGGAGATGGTAGSAGSAGSGNANAGGAAGSAGAPPMGPIPNIFYTDITHAPVTGGPNQGGALVTLFGRDFGAARGRVELGGQELTVIAWGDEAARGLSKVVVQLPAGTSVGVGDLQLISAGNQRSNTEQLTTTNKKIWYASPNGAGDGESLASPLSLSEVRFVYAPGDLVYLLDGEYDYATANCFDVYSCSWALDLTTVASQNEPVQIMGYPGANARFVGQTMGVRVNQDYARLGNIAARVLDQAGSDVIITSRQVTIVNCDLSAAGNKLTSTTGVFVTDGGRDVDLVGNYFHDLFTGSVAFTSGMRTERYNEYRSVSRVVAIDPAAPLSHYGNHATNMWHYALIGSGGGTPATIELFDNVVQQASYFIYQSASGAVGDVLLRNNSVDSRCLVGADEDNLTLPVRLESNVFLLSDRIACREPVPTAASISFLASGNHWGALTPPAEDQAPRPGNAALNQDLTPGEGSALCGGASKPAAPNDLDFLRNQRTDPTAIGAFECQQ